METFPMSSSSTMEAMQSSPPCLTADQSSSKRRRADAADRLGDLPDSLLHNIISFLGSRQAVQTSVLSRRWRHLWRDVPCVAIDEREFTGDNWEPFEDFADHMLTSIPLETRLDTFRLHLVTGSMRYSYDNHYKTADRWIRRGLRHFPATVDIRAAHGITVRWQPHRSDWFVARPQSLLVMGPCDACFTGRLTTLRLVGVKLTDGFFKDLGGHYPALEELHIERCQIPLFSVIASPTIRSLLVAEAQRSVPCAHLMIAAPRLAYLRLDIPYDGVDCNCRSGEAVPEPEPLASLAEASIRLTVEMFRRQLGSREWRKRKIEFFKSMRRFLGLLPNVTKLHLVGFITAAFIEDQEFPVIHSLKTLLLENCEVGLKFQALRSILWNTPNLENLGLNHCTFLATPAKNRRKRGQQPSKGHTSAAPVFWCKNLKSIEIKRLREDAPHLLEILSMIIEGMLLAWWLQVKISTTVTIARTEDGCSFVEEFLKAAPDRASEQ